eukprot:12419529-Karenia_brevis.AAC.1
MGKLELGREPSGIGANGIGRGRKSESNDRYELELIVSGSPFNTPKREIEEKLSMIEKEVEAIFKDKFAPSQLASIGILKFQNLDEKNDFKERLRKKRYTTSFKDMKLYIDENHDKTER